MSGGGKPSLAGVLSGRSGTPGPGNLYDKLGQLVEARTQTERLKPAVALVSAAGGETQSGGPIRSALEALKLGAELSADKETRQREADAAMAAAQVESQKVRQDGELGAANMLLTAIQALKSDGGGGGISLEGIASIIAAVAPLLQNQQQQGGGLTVEALTGLIAAVAPLIANRPNNDGVRELLTEFKSELKDLRREMQSGGQNQMPWDQFFNAMGKFQSFTGNDPATRIRQEEISLQKTLGLYEIQKRFDAQAAEAQANGELYGTVRDVVRDGMRRSTEGGPAPQIDGQPQAPRGHAIRCRECGHMIPFQGDPPAVIQCPNCEKTIRNLGAAS